MSQIKNELRENYQVIPRALIQDNKISDRARFLFCYMASKPSCWEFFQEPMAKELGYGIPTLRKYLQELTEAGWLKREGQAGMGKGQKEFGPVRYVLAPQLPNVDSLVYGSNILWTPKKMDTIKDGDQKTCTQINKRLQENKDSNKELYQDCVLLTPSEHARLVEEFGESDTAWMITKLNAYKLEKGKTYKSDYAAIRNWVVERLAEYRQKNPTTNQKVVETMSDYRKKMTR